jgi:hypothetical protein
LERFKGCNFKSPPYPLAEIVSLQLFECSCLNFESLLKEIGIDFRQPVPLDIISTMGAKTSQP